MSLGNQESEETQRTRRGSDDGMSEEETTGNTGSPSGAGV